LEVLQIKRIGSGGFVSVAFKGVVTDGEAEQGGRCELHEAS
jgi:hypothetical protein